MTKPVTTSFVLSVAGVEGIPLTIKDCDGAEIPLIEEINRIANVLALLKWRGTATFTINTSTGDQCWTCIVTFTDDIPTGVWNNTNHHLQGS